MVGHTHSAWARAAAMGMLAAWLPCAPLGLCARSAGEPSSTTAHHCCRETAVKISAVPQDCWVQSSAPTPGPPPPALPAPAAIAVHARPAPEIAVLNTPSPTAFSPLAIVLRI
jgi:hypothetical protein